jgi:parvulin-like peptidyl-prolyl isomerase
MGLLVCWQLSGIPSVAVVAQQAPPTENKSDSGSSVMAVVNGESITRNQLGQEVLRRYGEDVLEAMVNKQLILSACQAKGLEITQGEVDDEVARVAGKFGIAAERYLQMLQEERKISPIQYKRDIMWPMLAMRKLAADQIEVTPEEFNQVYLSQFGEAIKCRVIIVGNRDKAGQLLAQVRNNPASFGDLAKQHSEDATSASVRGFIPPIRHNSGDPQLEQAAFALKENEISDVVEIAKQFVILQCVQRMPATPPQPQLMPAIREQIVDRIRDEKMKNAATDLFAKLQQQAQVVNVLNDPALRQQYPGVAAMINGQRITLAQLTEECLQRHGIEVLDGEINRRILMQALTATKQTVTQQQLDEEVARAAESFGYLQANGQADVQRWLQEVTKGDAKTAELYVADSVWPSVAVKVLVDADGGVEVTEQDLARGFEANYGPRVEVLAIVLNDHRQAQKVWEMARNNPTEQFFGELAEQYSTEPVSQSNFGKVPPVRRFGGQTALEDEAFRLKPGELSGIVATGNQFVMMLCQGMTDPVVTEMSSVRDELEKDIREKKLRVAIAQKFDALKTRAQIDNLLAGSSQPGAKPAPPADPAKQASGPAAVDRRR